MVMNLCERYTDINRVKMIIAIEVHHKELKSIAMVFNSMQRGEINSSNHK